MKLILRLSLINFFQFAALTLAAPTADVERRDQIKQTFLENYRQYEKYAYGSDMIKPIAKSGGNSSEGAGLGATIVDSLSTFLIMGLSESDEYKRALAFVKAHEFTTTPGAPPPGEVSMYELTIRYIGGLLSAYQLAGEKSEQKFLVDKAKNLADALAKPAWSLKGQSIPFNDLNLTSGKPIPGRDVNLAEAGSLILEWSLLSKYTGDKKYLDLTRRSMDAIIAQKVEWPGIFPSRYHPENATANSQYFTIGGGSDSFYEYLFKFPVLLGQADHPFLKTYIDFTRSVRQHLASKTGVGNLTFTTDYHLDNKTAINVFSELACFSGGLYAYSGRLLRDENLIQFGLEIAESCGETYTQSALGLCPYAFGWFDASGEAKGWDNVSPARRNYYKEHGYFVNVAFWLQQSEVITSLMYAHRITGQDYWRDVAWRAFGNMRKYAKTDTAWACVDNVNDESAGLYDQTGPYLFSETFNYLYLLFDDPDTFSLEEYVFSTQGHPFKRQQKGDFDKVGATFDYKTIYTRGRGSQEASSASRVVASLKPTPDTLRPIEIDRIDQGRLHATKSLQSFIPTLTLQEAGAYSSGIPW